MLWRTSSARSRFKPPAGFILPCNPTLVDRPPKGPDWLHEVKHDGFRILAHKDGARVKLWSRRGTDYTDKLTRIAEALRGLPAERALIDGEAVVFRPDGRSDFEALLTTRGAASASFLAFDLIALAGEDLRLRPLEERRAALSRLVAGADARRSRPRAKSSSPRPASWASRVLCRNAPGASTGAARASRG
jgi:bifunctional non-homologous end joining protein LigD